MANDFSADFREVWAKEQQEVFYTDNVAFEIADQSFKSTMSNGDTLNRPKRSAVSVQQHTRGGEITIDTVSSTQESMTINGEFATGFYLDKFDDIQSAYNEAMAYGKDYGEKMAAQMDADTLAEVMNAETELSSVTLSTSNILAYFANAKKQLKRLDVNTTDLVAVISPDVEQILTEYGAARDTSMGDDMVRKGYYGKFNGFACYVSNNLTASATLGLATKPTADDTVTIDGVTFTFVSTIGTTPGNVLIGASVDTARANLAALIADPETTTANGVALATNDARKVANTWTATDDATADTLAFVIKGVGVLDVSETLTDATDAWADEKQHNVFGVRKQMTTLVVQSDITSQAKEVPNKLGKNYLSSMLYGLKTFADNAKKMVNAPINSASL